MPGGINEPTPKSVRGWLHGYVRATMDVDILIPEDLENHARVIAALSELEDHAAAELTPQNSWRSKFSSYLVLRKLSRFHRHASSR
jgi:hypothetical protein